jgi:hypothetical protein
MRLIEKKMLNAIEQGRNFSLDNTHVKIDANVAHVFLHGNHIASVMCDKDSRHTVVNKITLRQYPTPTTKSRLRALGVDVYTKKGITYLYGEAI